MKTFQRIGTETGALVESKNRAYGSSVTTVGAALRLLYPKGIRAEQMNDVGLLVRIWDKMMRIANDRRAFDENPYSDIAGYGILGVHMHQQQEKAPSCPGSASGPNAPVRPKAQLDFAAPNTKRRTTPSAAASNAPRNWPWHDVSCASTLVPGSIRTGSAHAHGATAAASANEAALRRLRGRARRSL